MNKILKYERPKLVSLTPEDWEEPFGVGQVGSQQSGCIPGGSDTLKCWSGAGYACINCGCNDGRRPN